MCGERDLNLLIASMRPELLDNEFVFVTTPLSKLAYLSDLQPQAMFVEKEGMSLILSPDAADQINLAYDSIFKCITLNVHSSLDAVGLTAAVSQALAKENISANVVAAFYHDHIFVQTEKAQQALLCLTILSQQFQE